MATEATEATEATNATQEQTDPVVSTETAEATEATETAAPAAPAAADDTVETKASETGDKGGDSGVATNTTEEKKESIYSSPMPARIEVGNGYRYNRPLNFYVDRARRILRTEKTLEVTGHGTRVSKACTLVEVLKRQKIASIRSVSTGMETQPYFTRQRGNRGGDALWSQPTTVIRFTLEQAEYAQYVSDYHQRKVIEIFEKADTNNDGKLSFQEIEDLEMASAFYANDEQIAQSKEFLTNNGEPDKALNLPNFIKYSSILIHPLLKDELFKQALSDKFGIVTGDSKQNRDEDDATD